MARGGVVFAIQRVGRFEARFCVIDVVLCDLWNAVLGVGFVFEARFHRRCTGGRTGLGARCEWVLHRQFGGSTIRGLRWLVVAFAVISQWIGYSRFRRGSG